MNKFYKAVLIYYVDGTWPKEVTMDHLVVLTSLFRRKGWIEPCDTHPYWKASQAGLLEFLND